jgi:hypothetical protein
MTDQQNDVSTPATETTAPKKVSLAEAVKQKLAQKKAEQASGQQQKGFHESGSQTMKSQHTKKINNQRKRMGV